MRQTLIKERTKYQRNLAMEGLLEGKLMGLEEKIKADKQELVPRLEVSSITGLKESKLQVMTREKDQKKRAAARSC